MRKSLVKGFISVPLVVLIFTGGLIFYVLKQTSGLDTEAARDSRGKCPETSIWNGKTCRPILLQGDTAIVGADTPIASREELEEIEKSFIKRSFLRFLPKLFNPTTQKSGQEIQDIRLRNFKQIGSDYERTWEFILNADAKTKLDANKNILGVDATALLIKHAEAVNEIWSNSLPKINRKAVLKRIMVVDSNVLSRSGGGWRVVNDHSFGWWANDDLNGIRGFIPYDIDSRWALDDTWPDYLMSQSTTFGEVKIDYAMLHELSHHLPVGDNYVYNMGSGHGFEIQLPDGKTVFFVWSQLSFMYNDHMSGPASKELTAPSSYYIKFHWDKNPKQIRNAQDSPYPTNEVYGRYFYNTLNVKIGGLDQAGIEGCNYLRQEPTPVDPNIPVKLSASSDMTSIAFANGECTLTLNKDQQVSAFPGGYIGLQKSGITFPIFIPRNLMETFYWKDNSLITPFEYTFTLQATPKLKDALDYYISKINSSSDTTVNMWPSSLWAYMDVISSSNLPSDTILYGSIDQQDNQYILEYRYPNCRQFDNNISGCAATTGCAWYACSNQCWPSGTPLSTACP